VGKNIRRLFGNKFTNAQRDIDLSTISPKYRSSDRVYSRMNKYINLMNKNFDAGSCLLDFGTAHGGLVILGNLHGYNMCGLDIKYAYREKEELSNYYPLQENLRADGYNIFSEDTSIFPWSYFDDNQFDGIIANFAIDKHAGGFDSEENPRELRIKELIRVCKPNSVWMIHPVAHLSMVNDIFEKFDAIGIDRKGIRARKL